MELKIEHLPTCRIAYIRRIGPYGPRNREAMESLKNWVKDNRLLTDESVILGIAQDDPTVTKPEQCRYDACLVIADDTRISDDAVSLGSIVGGRHAVFAIDHTAEAMGRAWNDIFPELQRQGLQADNTRPVIERYAARMIRAHLCELCVPVY